MVSKVWDSEGICLHLNSGFSEIASKDVDPGNLGLATLLTRSPGIVSSKYKHVLVDGNLSGEASQLSKLRTSRVISSRNPQPPLGTY